MDAVGRIDMQERGIALSLVLVMIVLIGTMIAGTFFVSNQEYRTQSSAQFEQQALSAAEFGLGRVVQTWDVNAAAGMVVGQVRADTDTVATGLTALTRTTRLANTLFSVVSEGRSGT